MSARDTVGLSVEFDETDRDLLLRILDLVATEDDTRSGAIAVERIRYYESDRLDDLRDRFRRAR